VVAQVQVVTDNAGMELVSDLALAHYLLAAGCRRTAHTARTARSTRSGM
jgi:hypothetical protein